MAHELLLLWLTAFALMGSPGPATISLAGLGVAFGVRPGLPYLAGIVLGTCLVLVAVAAGVTAAVLAVPGATSALTAAAVLYIVYLAWRIATAPVGPEGLDATHGAPPAFGPGLALAVTNPKAFVAIGAVHASHLLLPQQPVLDGALKVAALAPVVLIVNVGWLLLGATLSRRLADPRVRRTTQIGCAAALLLSAGLALLAP